MINRFFQLVFCLAITLPVISQTKTDAKITYTFTASGENVETMQSMLPTSIEIMISPKGMYSRTNGGLAGLMGDVLITKSGKYTIKHQDKTITAIGEEESVPEPSFEKLNETEVILGYTCQKYKTKTSSVFGETISYVWVTDAITYPQIPGIPNKTLPGPSLKLVNEVMGITTTMTATEVSTQAQDPKLFKLPKGYKKVKAKKKES